MTSQRLCPLISLSEILVENKEDLSFRHSFTRIETLKFVHSSRNLCRNFILDYFLESFEEKYLNAFLSLKIKVSKVEYGIKILDGQVMNKMYHLITLFSLIKCCKSFLENLNLYFNFFFWVKNIFCLLLGKKVNLAVSLDLTF